MKALLKKDFYVLLRQMRTYLVFIALFAIMPGMNMSIFAVVYCGMLPYTAMAYDERSKWNDLAAMMPYTAGDLVLSKYVLGWAAIAATTALSLVGHLLLGGFLPETYGEMTLGSLLPTFCMGLLMMAVTLPPMFRFGVEKGRMFFMILMIVVACGGAGLVQGVIGSGDEIPAALNTLVNLGIPVLSVIATAISVPLSMKLHSRRAD